MKFKKRGIAIVLSSLIIASSINLFPIHAENIGNSDNNLISEETLIETTNGFKLNYKQFEDGKDVYYFEECVEDTIYTKKYIKVDNELELISEVNTRFITDNNDCILEINDITNNKITTQTLENILVDDSETYAVNRKPHPKDKTYMFNYATMGHEGVHNMSKAVLCGVVARIAGGTIKTGVAVSVATAIINGGWSNLYYKREMYIPNTATGSIKGKPIWKQVTYYYRDKNRKYKVGDTIYSQATSFVK